MRYAWGIVMLLALIVGTAQAQGSAQTPGAAPSPNLPEQILGLVEIASVDALQEQLQAYVTAISPGVTVPAAATQGLAALIHTTNPTLIETGRPAQFLWVRTGEGKVGMATLFSVKDPVAFSASLAPDFKKGPELEGLTSYTRERQELDQQAFMKASPDQRQNPTQFVKTVTETLVVGSQEKTVSIGHQAEAVRAALSLRRDGAIKAERTLGGGDAAAWFRPAALVQHLATQPGGLFGPLREQIGMALGAQGGGAPDPRALALANAQLDALESVFRQLNTGAARLSLDAKEVRLWLSAEAQAQTPLAAYLATVPKGAPLLLQYLPSDAFAVGAFKVGNVEPLVGWISDIYRKVVTAAHEDAAPIDERRRQAMDLVRATGDEIAFAVRQGKALTIVEAVRVKDPARFQALLQQSPGLLNVIGLAQRKSGMKITPAPAPIAYNGRQILSWLVTAPIAQGTEDQAGKQELLAALFGDTLTAHGVMMDNTWVVAVGAESLDQIKQAVDGRSKLLKDQAGFKSAFDALPPEGAGFAWLRLTDLAQLQLSMARGVGGAGQVPEVAFKPAPGLSAAVTTSGSRVSGELRVPSAAIKAVVDGFKGDAGPAAGPDKEATPLPSKASPTASPASIAK